MECVARGYLSGSGWVQYMAGGAVCGVPLPPGLRESDRLPEPIFTPTTKAAEGHDLPLTPAETRRAGRRRPVRAAARAGARALRAHRRGGARARHHPGGHEVRVRVRRRASCILIDEVGTPDSSRFWPADGYAPGRTPAVVRQAVRARLAGRERVGPGAAAAARCRPTSSRGRPPRTARPTAAHRRSRSRRTLDADGGRRRDGLRVRGLVSLKDGLFDPQGKAVEGALPALGWTNVSGVRVGKHIELDVEAAGPGRGDGTGRGDGRPAAVEPRDRGRTVVARSVEAKP